MVPTLNVNTANVPWDLVEFYHGPMIMGTDGSDTPTWIPLRDKPHNWDVLEEGSGWFYRFGPNGWEGPYVDLAKAEAEAVIQVQRIAAAKAVA